MKKIFIATIVAFTQIVAYSQNSELGITLKGDKHCPCWAKWNSPKGCQQGGFICMEFSISNPNTTDIDKIALDLTTMKATFQVHTSNYSELNKIILNNKIHNEMDNSMIDKEILNFFGYTGSQEFRIKKGDYDYQLINDYYVFNLDIEVKE